MRAGLTRRPVLEDLYRTRYRRPSPFCQVDPESCRHGRRRAGGRYRILQLSPKWPMDIAITNDCMHTWHHFPGTATVCVLVAALFMGVHLLSNRNRDSTRQERATLVWHVRAHGSTFFPETRDGGCPYVLRTVQYSITPIITILHTTIHGVIAIFFVARIPRICMVLTKRYNDIKQRDRKHRYNERLYCTTRYSEV
jgi:hypothetical protein